MDKREKNSEVIKKVNEHDKEILASLQTSADIVALVNECIDAFNKMSAKTESTINNINSEVPKVIARKVDKIAKSEEFQNQIAARLLSGQIGRGEIVYDMLSQEIKDILRQRMMDDVLVYCSNEAQHHSPLIIIDTFYKSITINKNIKSDYRFNHRNGAGVLMKVATLNLNTDYWTGINMVEFFYHSASNTMYVVNYFGKEEILKECIYLGGVTTPISECNNKLPVMYNGRFIPAVGTGITMSGVPGGVHNIASVTACDGNSAGAVFHVDTDKMSFRQLRKNGVYSVTNGERIIDIPLDKVKFKAEKISKTDTFLCCYDEINNELVCYSHMYGYKYSHCIPLGVFSFGAQNSASLVLPFSYDEDGYYYPGKDIKKELSYLHCDYIEPKGYTTKTVARIDFTEKNLIIPPVNGVYAINGRQFAGIYDRQENGIEIPFVENTKDRYQYLVGGESGLEFITSREFNSNAWMHTRNQAYYFGYIDTKVHAFELKFECAKVRTLSILGDSISTYEGYIPDGQYSWYCDENKGINDVKETWWYRVLNRCGMVLNTNNSWGGSRVSNISTLPTAAQRATKLDNGKAPDVIIVYIGVNDYIGSVPLGDYRGRGPVPESDNTFSEGYGRMLHMLASTYTSSKIYACTLIAARWGKNLPDGPSCNEAGVYLAEYNDAITSIARAYNIEVIDLESCGITVYNAKEYMEDYNTKTGEFVHPSAKGHKLISNKVVQALIKK